MLANAAVSDFDDMPERYLLDQGEFSRRRALKMKIVGLAAMAFTRLANAAQSAIDYAAGAAAQRWKGLRERIMGTVVSKEMEQYEELRRNLLWTAIKPDSKPEAIIQVGSASDIGEAVKFARANALKISIRGRGHHTSAPIMRDGAITIDLERLNGIEIDAKERIATVEAGVTSGHLLGELLKHGLAFPVAHCPTVPMSGYLLGGGHGWSSKAWGTACSNVTGIDLVTADGESIYADAKRNSDYFWAARGAGPGFFGIATRYHLKLHSKPRAIRRSSLVYPIAAVGEVAPWLSELSDKLPADVELICMLSNPPNAPGNENRTLTVAADAFVDSYEEARAALEPLKTGPGAFTRSSFNRHSSLYLGDGRTGGSSLRRVSDSHWIDVNPTESMIAFCQAKLNPPSAQTAVFFSFNPCPKRDAANPDMAQSVIGRTLVLVLGAWEKPSDDGANISWFKRTSSVLDSVSIGHYINQCHFPLSKDRPNRCFSPENWSRLEKLRARYDPEEVFTYFD